jgi:hypothetical protein
MGDQSLSAEFKDLVSRHLRDIDDRRDILQSCCNQLMPSIDISGPANEFAARVWEKLSTYGEVSPGRPATVAFLEELRHNVGIDQREIIDILIRAIRAPMTNLTPPPQTDNDFFKWQGGTLLEFGTMIYQLGNDVGALRQEVQKTCVVVDQMSDITQTLVRVENRTEAVEHRVEQNRRDIIANHRVTMTVVVVELFVILTLGLALYMSTSGVA